MILAASMPPSIMSFSVGGCFSSLLTTDDDLCFCLINLLETQGSELKIKGDCFNLLSDDYICRTADTCTELNEGQGMAILVPACLAAMAAGC